MSKYLFIVESPNKCQKIRSILGNDYNIMASVGHVRQIPKKGMNIDIKNGFEPTYEISNDRRDVVKKIKEAAKNAEKIYLATDKDREGENIAYSIYELLDNSNKKKCVRITFTEITKKAVLDAIHNPRDIDMKLVDAQKARSVLDRLIGYKVSPILWYTVGSGTSAGRVQSIALKFICQRENEISAFKPQDFWYIDALLKCKKGEFWAKVVTKDKDNRYLDEKLSQDDFEKLKNAQFKLEKIERKEKKIDPYPPFDTSSLQTSCSSIFGWSVKKTSTLAQSIYAAGKCFLPGTLITTKDGRIVPIEKLCSDVESVTLQSIGSGNQSAIWTECTPLTLQHNGTIVDLSVNGGTILSITPDHIFPVFDSLNGLILEKKALDIIPETDYLLRPKTDCSTYLREAPKHKINILDVYMNKKRDISFSKIRFKFKDGFVQSIPNIKSIILKHYSVFTYLKYSSLELLPLQIIFELLESGQISKDIVRTNYLGIRSGGSKIIAIPFDLPPSFFYLAGLIASDGHLPKNSGKFLLDTLLLKNPRKKNIESYVDVIGEINKLVMSLGGRSNKHLRFCCSPLQHLIWSLGIPEGNKSKIVDFPELALMDHDYCVAFLSGLWDGDGYFTEVKQSDGRISAIQAGYTSSSSIIIHKIRMVLARYGIHSYLHEDNRSENGIIKSIKVSLFDVPKLYELLNNYSRIKTRVYEQIKIKKGIQVGNSKNPSNMPIINMVISEAKRLGINKNQLSILSSADVWRYSRKFLQNRNRQNEIPRDVVRKYEKILNSQSLKQLLNFDFCRIVNKTIKQYNGPVYCFQSNNGYFLVEDGLWTHNCTYIRSDSYTIAQEAIDEVRNLIKKSISSNYLPDKPNVYFKKSKAAAQEAHECIRPTHCEDTGDDIPDSDEQRLYKLIRSRFIACQMTPMVVDTVAYYVKSSTKHDLIAKGQSIKFDGWYKVYKYTAAKEEVLPDAEENEELALKDIKRTKHSTQPPPRYNEGSLVKKMETEGVGRPSTYASIMDSIQKRAYVEKIVGKKGALGATLLGMRVFNYLEPSFKDFFMDIKFTASVEDDLDKITKGEKKYLEVVETVYDIMQKEIKKADGVEKKDVSTGEKCFVCKKGLIVKKHGKFGDFYACDHYSAEPSCKAIFVKNKDGKFIIKEGTGNGEDTGEVCCVCKKGKIVKKKGKFGDFFSCDRYPSCKSIFVKNEDGKFVIKVAKSAGKETGEKCPRCKKGNIVKRNGQYGEWYSCSNFPQCKTIFEKNGDGFSIKVKGQWNKKDNKSNAGEEKEESGEEIGIENEE